MSLQLTNIMNVRHDDDFEIALNFLGEDGTPLNNSEVKFEFIYTLFSYINGLKASFGLLYNLEEIENFPILSFGKFSDKAIICTGFNFFKYSMGFSNDKIKLRCFIANDSYINSLQFSNESPFDYGSTHINLLRAKFEKDSLLSLFNRLPDFTNSNSRTINIVDNPGTSELMEEDIKIATDKNWVVITK